MARVKVVAHTQATLFEALRPEWNSLLGRSAANLIFLTWEWQSTWWHAYEAGDLWVLAVHSDDDRLVGIAPWFIQVKPDGERVVRTIGCVDVTDYMDIIAEPEHIDGIQQALADYVAQNTGLFDRINLCNVPEDSRTYATFPDHLRQAGMDAKLVLQEVCPIIRLPDSFEGYLESLDKKQRHELRRKMRRAENEAEIEYYTVDSSHDFEQEIETFFRLMAASQPSKAEFLADPRNNRFFRDILHVAFACGWLRMTFLKVDGHPAACYCDFDYNGHMLVYNSGLSLDYAPHLSTGIVLLTYNIRHAIETGHIVYDFLRGNESYKYRMGAVDTRVYMLLARKPEQT